MIFFFSSTVYLLHVEKHFPYIPVLLVISPTSFWSKKKITPKGISLVSSLFMAFLLIFSICSLLGVVYVSMAFCDHFMLCKMMVTCCYWHLQMGNSDWILILHTLSEMHKNVIKRNLRCMLLHIEL